MNKKTQQDHFKKATPFFMNLKKAAPFFMNMKKAAPFFTNIKNDPIFHIKNNKANLKKRASFYFKKENNFEAEWILAYRFSAPANIFTFRRKPSWISFGK